MHLRKHTFAVALLLASAGHTLAQDAMPGHDMSSMSAGEPEMTSSQIQLPEICRSAGEQASGGMSMGMQHGMDEAHAALMDGMDEMNQMMMTAMMAEDIDVAFVCGMVPHHQSAVNMAKAELEHGDDEWAKQLAQSVIDNQQREIEDMLTWLEERGAEERSR